MPLMKFSWLGVAETGGQFKRFVDGDLGRDVSPVQHFENGETEQGQLDLAEPIHAPVLREAFDDAVEIF